MDGTGTHEVEPIEISVVIAAHNAAATLAEQLDALATQDYNGAWEVIVAVQPSSDDTRAVAESRAKERVRVIEAYDQMGAGYARNVGVSEARGEWIAFCDADDVVTRSWLSELVAHRHTPVVAGSYISVPSDCDLTTIQDTTVETPRVHNDFLQGAYSCSMLVRRDAFTQVGGFNLHFHRAHDLELSWRLQVAGFPVTLAPSATVLKRERATEKGRWMQWYRWSRYEPALFRQFAKSGMPRSPLREAAVHWVWLVVRLPRLRDDAVRAEWRKRSATRFGRLVGSLLERRCYL